ncbi:MAG: hypothetical protein LRY52_04230 [Sulfurospirillum cavolei]|nr:hypothetical protein [Sulfurospirillum cavolei]
MIHYLFRHNKDYSRFNIIKHLLKDVTCKNDIFILLPFSKNQFFKAFFLNATASLTTFLSPTTTPTSTIAGKSANTILVHGGNTLKIG